MTGKIRNDLTGKQFSYLTVIERSSDRGNGKKPVVKWTCRCRCGKILDVKSDALLSGHTTSCGCKKIIHNESYGNKKTRLYNIWKCMRQRCLNPNNPNYRNYGRKGVGICKEWQDYATFKEWAFSSGYADHLSIDRIDVNGDYSPDNCRWADNKTQANNTTRNRFIEFHGEKLTMSQIADRLNTTYSTIQHRLERGQPLEGARYGAETLSERSYQVH